MPKANTSTYAHIAREMFGDSYREIREQTGLGLATIRRIIAENEKNSSDPKKRNSLSI